MVNTAGVYTRPNGGGIVMQAYTQGFQAGDVIGSAKITWFI